MPDTGNLKKMLEQMLEKKKQDKALEDSQRQQKNEGDRNKILENVGKDFGSIIQPYIDKMGENSRMSAEELKRIISESVQVTAPNVDTAGIENVIAQAFANLKFPEPKVSVAAPVIPAPVIKVNAPEVKFPTSMKLEPNAKPFPVIMMDQGGKPMLFPTAGSSGPGFPMQVLDQVNNALRVSGNFSISASNSSTQAIDSSGNAYSQANPMPVVFSSSATTATNIVDSSGVAYTGSNAFSVAIGSAATGSDGATNNEVLLQGNNGSTGKIGAFLYASNGTTNDKLRNTAGEGNALRVQQANDAVSSVVINSGTITTVTTLTGITNSVATVLTDSAGVAYSGSNPVPTTASVTLSAAIGQGDSASALRTIQAGDSVSSVVVNSGTITTVSAVTGITNSVAIVQLDRDGNPWQPEVFGPGDAATAMRVLIAGNSDASVVVNSGTITTVTTLTGITNTVNVRLDTPDGLISAANPMQVTLAAGGLDSMFVYQARTTNPTAVADGADVRPKADKLGRVVTRTHQVRDLIVTAYATLSTQAETTVLAASAGIFQDLIMLTATNGSAAAWKVDIRAVTGGNIIHTMNIPANTGPVGFAPAVPWPQDATGNNWTATISSGSDVSNANLFISGLFSKEI